jgi:hypothetical protein
MTLFYSRFFPPYSRQKHSFLNKYSLFFIYEFRAQGLGVVFKGGFPEFWVLEKSGHFLGKSGVDVLHSLSGYPLVGGSFLYNIYLLS